MVCDGETERRWVNQWMRRWLFWWKEIREPINGYDLCPLLELLLLVADATRIRSKEDRYRSMNSRVRNWRRERVNMAAEWWRW